jgi:hypothetical protein
MNIELRGEVLEKALILEDAVNQLVLLYLGIKKENRRAIGHKSGTLTYKNILDLLYDIDVLENQEYSALLLLMEIRNQFMHNRACNSFEKAVELLGPDKRKRLVKFDRIGADKLEDQYNNAYLCLAGDTLGIIMKKLEKKEKDIEEKSAYLKKLVTFAPQYSDFIYDKLNGITEKYTVSGEDLINEGEFERNQLKVLFHLDLTKLKIELVQKFEEFTADLFDSNEEMAARLIR